MAGKEAWLCGKLPSGLRLLFVCLELQSELLGSFAHCLQRLIIGRKGSVSPGFHSELNV